jgi:hypothetical protein
VISFFSPEDLQSLLQAIRREQKPVVDSVESPLPEQVLATVRAEEMVVDAPETPKNEEIVGVAEEVTESPVEQETMTPSLEQAIVSEPETVLVPDEHMPLPEPGVSDTPEMTQENTVEKKDDDDLYSLRNFTI